MSMVQPSSPPPSLTLPWREALLPLAGRWRVLDEGLGGGKPDPARNIGRDVTLGHALAYAPPAESVPLFRVWTSRPALVATRRETRHPRFEAAARESARRGWPVVVRESGGTLVPHLDGTLHLTLLLPRRPGGEPTTEAVYALLCEPVLEALGRVGIEAGYGAVPDSFCDGRHNLVAGGRKIAGTSQRWRGGIPGSPVRPGYVLAHMSLFVEGDMAAATAEVNRFLAEAGSGEAFDPGAVVSLSDLDGGADGAAPGLLLLSRVHASLRGVLTEGGGSLEREPEAPTP